MAGDGGNDQAWVADSNGKSQGGEDDAVAKGTKNHPCKSTMDCAATYYCDFADAVEVAAGKCAKLTQENPVEKEENKSSANDANAGADGDDGQPAKKGDTAGKADDVPPGKGGACPTRDADGAVIYLNNKKYAKLTSTGWRVTCKCPIGYELGGDYKGSRCFKANKQGIHIEPGAVLPDVFSPGKAAFAPGLEQIYYINNEVFDGPGEGDVKDQIRLFLNSYWLATPDSKIPRFGVLPKKLRFERLHDKWLKTNKSDLFKKYAASKLKEEEEFQAFTVDELFKIILRECMGRHSYISIQANKQHRYSFKWSDTLQKLFSYVPGVESFDKFKSYLLKAYATSKGEDWHKDISFGHIALKSGGATNSFTVRPVYKSFNKACKGANVDSQSERTLKFAYEGSKDFIFTNKPKEGLGCGSAAKAWPEAKSIIVSQNTLNKNSKAIENLWKGSQPPWWNEIIVEFDSIISNRQVSINGGNPEADDLAQIALFRKYLRAALGPDGFKENIKFIKAGVNSSFKEVEYGAVGDFKQPYQITVGHIGETDKTTKLNKYGKLLTGDSKASKKVSAAVPVGRRSYVELIEGKLANITPIGYRIVKYLVNDGKEIQSFYVPHESNQKTQRIHIIDTQLKYGVEYGYSFNPIILVHGTRYKYKDAAKVFDYESNEIKYAYIDMAPEIESFSRIIEVPGVIDGELETLSTINFPPLPPLPIPYPIMGVNNKMSFFMEKASGGRYGIYKKLIPLEQWENGWSAAVKKEEVEDYDLKEGEMLFSSFEEHDKYLAYRLDTPPKDILDFKSIHKQIDANPSFFNDEIKPNKKYYYMFKTLGVGGVLSYPSDVFVVELIDDNGTIYPIVEIYEIKKVKKYVSSIDFRKNLRVRPALLQSAPNKKDKNIGYIQPPVFDKYKEIKPRFKFRLVSNKSQRKIDLNVNFKKDLLKNKVPTPDTEVLLSWGPPPVIEAPGPGPAEDPGTTNPVDTGKTTKDVPSLPGVTVDAALQIPGTKKVFFFIGNFYWEWDGIIMIGACASPKKTGTPKHWAGISPSLDAAIAFEGRYYFFKGTKYWRCDTIEGDNVGSEGYPRDIVAEWPGIPASALPLDAAAVIAGQAYFFKGNQVWAVDPETDKVDDCEWPKTFGPGGEIFTNWPINIDAAYEALEPMKVPSDLIKAALDDASHYDAGLSTNAKYYADSWSKMKADLYNLPRNLVAAAQEVAFTILDEEPDTLTDLKASDFSSIVKSFIHIPSMLKIASAHAVAAAQAGSASPWGAGSAVEIFYEANLNNIRIFKGEKYWQWNWLAHELIPNNGDGWYIAGTAGQPDTGYPRYGEGPWKKCPSDDDKPGDEPCVSPYLGTQDAEAVEHYEGIQEAAEGDGELAFWSWGTVDSELWYHIAALKDAHKKSIVAAHQAGIPFDTDEWMGGDETLYEIIIDEFEEDGDEDGDYAAWPSSQEKLDQILLTPAKKWTGATAPLPADPSSHPATTKAKWAQIEDALGWYVSEEQLFSTLAHLTEEEKEWICDDGVWDDSENDSLFANIFYDDEGIFFDDDIANGLAILRAHAKKGGKCAGKIPPPQDKKKFDKIISAVKGPGTDEADLAIMLAQMSKPGRSYLFNSNEDKIAALDTGETWWDKILDEASDSAPKEKEYLIAAMSPERPTPKDWWKDIEEELDAFNTNEDLIYYILASLKNEDEYPADKQPLPQGGKCPSGYTTSPWKVYGTSLGQYQGRCLPESFITRQQVCKGAYIKGSKWMALFNGLDTGEELETMQAILDCRSGLPLSSAEWYKKKEVDGVSPPGHCSVQNYTDHDASGFAWPIVEGSVDKANKPYAKKDWSNCKYPDIHARYNYKAGKNSYYWSSVVADHWRTWPGGQYPNCWNCVRDICRGGTCNDSGKGDKCYLAGKYMPLTTPPWQPISAMPEGLHGTYPNYSHSAVEQLSHIAFYVAKCKSVSQSYGFYTCFPDSDENITLLVKNLTTEARVWFCKGAQPGSAATNWIGARGSTMIKGDKKSLYAHTLNVTDGAEKVEIMKWCGASWWASAVGGGVDI